MEDSNYKGLYAIEILLTDTAWTNEEYNKRIRNGELEKILRESKGVKSFWRGASGRYQNAPVIENAESAFELMEKLNQLPYVRQLNLLKDGLRFKEGYIHVDNKIVFGD